MSALNVRGLRAVLHREPWLDSYELYLGGRGAHPFMATRIENCRIVYETQDEAAVNEPLLRLSQDEVDALAKCLLAEARPEDATLDALKDARAVRDRLLAMLEQRGIR